MCPHSACLPHGRAGGPLSLCLSRNPSLVYLDAQGAASESATAGWYQQPVILDITYDRHAVYQEYQHAGASCQQRIVALYVLDVYGIDQIHYEHGAKRQGYLKCI